MENIRYRFHLQMLCNSGVCGGAVGQGVFIFVLMGGHGGLEVIGFCRLVFGWKYAEKSGATRLLQRLQRQEIRNDVDLTHERYHAEDEHYDHARHQPKGSPEDAERVPDATGVTFSYEVRHHRCVRTELLLRFSTELRCDEGFKTHISEEVCKIKMYRASLSLSQNCYAYFLVMLEFENV